MAQATFNNIAISAMVTTVGDEEVKLDDEQELFGYSDIELKRLKKSIGLNTRYLASEDVCTTDLAVQSANALFEGVDIAKDDIDALIFVTQSPDYRAPSSAIILQDRIGLSKNIVAFDMNLGCSGFVVGLFNAFSFVNSGLKNVLLIVGDVNRYFTGKRDKIFAPLMGDAASAILVQAKPAPASHFVLHSDGSGYNHLIIPAGGLRKPSSPQTQEETLREDGAYRSDEHLYMNGKEVFNFAVRTVPPLIDEVLAYANKDIEEVDYFVLHQANRYILQTIGRKLGVAKEKVPLETGTIYGNQNAASIPGTINGFLSDAYQNKGLYNLFAGFGIGLSWAAATVYTENMFAPKTQIYQK
jgi:3-oxoacyl-[acyl-carrier-protein] synthase-3